MKVIHIVQTQSDSFTPNKRMYQNEATLQFHSKFIGIIRFNNRDAERSNKYIDLVEYTAQTNYP